jgi:hypothetical protein
MLTLIDVLVSIRNNQQNILVIIPSNSTDVLPTEIASNDLLLTLTSTFTDKLNNTKQKKNLEMKNSSKDSH